jgi:hypothetical protein
MAITVPSALKRDVLLRQGMRAFKNRILPVMAFARKFESVPLEGTNKVTVPYFPLASGASSDWNPATGYVIGQNQALQTKEVTINKRKFRGVAFTSDEWNRQPYLNQEEFIRLEAEKLADDVFADIWTLVTAANYAGTTLAAGAASAFDLDEVLSLRRLCGEANWPKVPRGLVLDGAYWENLHKDTRLGNQNYGSAGAAQEGAVSGKVGGFSPYEVPLLPDNGAEKVVGAAIYPSAILVGFAPIRPHPALMKVIDYQVITDSDTGLSLEYRQFVDPKLDSVSEVIECNYGFNIGEAAALKRITKP